MNRESENRKITRTSDGLTEEPSDFDVPSTLPPKPAPPKKPNRAARRKLFKMVKARSAERKAVRRAHDEGAKKK